MAIRSGFGLAGKAVEVVLQAQRLLVAVEDDPIAQSGRRPLAAAGVLAEPTQRGLVARLRDAPD